MIAGAYPFLIYTAKYFEALERTGTLGAFIADTLMPATLIGYCVLILVLKKRAYKKKRAASLHFVVFCSVRGGLTTLIINEDFYSKFQPVALAK
jgi:hypothetical protein